MEKFLNRWFKRKDIHRTTDNKRELYLIRWTLFRCQWFSIRLHKIMLSDDDGLHDHPFGFVSIILKGGYKEQVFSRDRDRADKRKPFHKAISITRNKCTQDPNIEGTNFSELVTSGRHMIFTYQRKPGNILYRPAEFSHRLIVEDGPAWTLVFMTAKFREWGFWGIKGWAPWHTYTTNEKC